MLPFSALVLALKGRPANYPCELVQILPQLPLLHWRFGDVHPPCRPPLLVWRRASDSHLDDTWGNNHPPVSHCDQLWSVVVGYRIDG